MGMNMYVHELKSLRISAILWVIAMIALAGLYFGIYPSIVKNASAFTQIMGSYPASIRATLGVSLANITSLLGYYVMIYMLVSLLAAIQAMNCGVSILSKESRERTADFLLVKPVSRSAIVTAKLLASITMLVVTNVVYDVAALILAEIVKTTPFNGTVFLLINLTLLFLQLIFLAIGLFLSVLFRQIKSVLSISLGVVFGFYILGALMATGKSGAVRYLSPFRYFNAQYIIAHKGYETSYLLVGLVIDVVGIVVSYMVYGRKDIHAVR